MIVLKRVEHTLLHPDTGVQYTFRLPPGADTTEVTHVTGRSRLTYEVTTTEARELWLRLIRKGYEKF
jgi:hypothetical protein